MTASAAPPRGTPGAVASLERVCLHESAHCVVARALGASGFVRIARVVDGGAGEPRYAGAFQMHGDLGERDWRVVALAGTIAEWIHADAALDARAITRRLRSPQALSPVDARLAGGFDAADVERCLALLRVHWPVVAAEARERAQGIAADRPAPEP